jgi:uncharacterized protein (DUF427 family)
MKATWNGKVIAQADNDDLIKIEGNWYFPPDSINREFFKDSDLRTECYWKGTASYYDVVVDGQANDGAAWYYPVPKDGSVQRVSNDFSNYVAFWRGVDVVA